MTRHAPHAEGTNDEGETGMLGFIGYTKDAETGEGLPSIGFFDHMSELDELVAAGVLEQTNWSGYPMTYIGPAGVFLGWVEQLPEHRFRTVTVRDEDAPSGSRFIDGIEAQAYAIQGLRSVDPERRIQADFWDQS